MLATVLGVSSLVCAVLGLQFTILFKIVGTYERLARLETKIEMMIVSQGDFRSSLHTLERQVLDLSNRVIRLEESISKGN